MDGGEEKIAREEEWRREVATEGQQLRGSENNVMAKETKKIDGMGRPGLEGGTIGDDMQLSAKLGLV